MGIDREALLEQLRRDTKSGATTLAICTLEQLIAQLSDDDPEPLSTLEKLIKSLQGARPSMVPLTTALDLWRVQLASAQSPPQARQLLASILDKLKLATDRLIDKACQLIPKNALIITHSRSSAVMGLFRRLAKQGHPFEVIATLSSPGNEGTLVASELNDLAVPVTLITEAQIGLFMGRADLVISGCDNWLTDGYFVNKAGTYLLALAARDQRKPFWVLADSFKNSGQSSQTAHLEEMPGEELGGPEGPCITSRNIYFETVPNRLISGRIDETGIHPQAKDREQAAKP